MPIAGREGLELRFDVRRRLTLQLLAA